MATKGVVGGFKTAMSLGSRGEAAVAFPGSVAGSPAFKPLYPGGVVSNPNLKVDGSGTPVVFYTGPAADSGEVWLAHTLILTYDGSTAYDPDKFGGEATNLSSGLKLIVGGIDFGVSIPIKKNGDPSVLSASTEVQSTASAFHVTHTWDFVAMFGGPVVLRGADVVSLTVSEDLSALSATSNLYALMFATVL